MYLGSWKIDDYLTFPVNTHTAATGAATDADAVPPYRIYEDETGTPILTGNTAKLDDANTTGFYTERIQLTAGNGFEKGKTYTIYIAATVDSIAGTISHSFQIEAEVDANVVSDKTGYDLNADQSAVTIGTTNVAANMRGTDSASTASALAAVDAKIDIIDTVVDAIKISTDLLPSSIKKNTALATVPFVMVDSDGVPLTGLTVTAQRSIDGAAFAACANSPVEIGSGAYYISWAAADVNGDTILFKYSATGAKITWVPVYTKE